MYTDIKGVQILISLLKQYEIRHVVISPGTRNTSLAHSIEDDPFFCCYSIVDERSAAYFALGIAEALDEPVCVSCTAATATCNYFPAIKEAYERNIQLIALTADQDPQRMFHMEEQCINQVDMYHGYVKYAVDVPKVITEMDSWYFNRCLNEAFLELNHNGKGPVQINYHMDYSLDEISSFPVEKLPEVRKIDRISNPINWNEIASELNNKKKILVVGANYYSQNNVLRKQIEIFTKKYNCVVLCDTYANAVSADAPIYIISALGYVIVGKMPEELFPDLIISFGSAYYTPNKGQLMEFAKKAPHWQISSDGMINDGFFGLKKIFECTPELFFSKVNEKSLKGNDYQYSSSWKNIIEYIHYPNLEFTNFYVIKEFCAMVPEDALLHTTVLDSIRMSNYVYTHPSVECFANVGADGIDGAVSTYYGQAEQTDKLAFLLIGDLTLLYDMNMLVKNLKNNMRILVINNYAGAEFHKNFGTERIPSLDNLVAAGHKTKIEYCAQIANANYMTAKNNIELAKCLEEFVKDNNRPMILEVFTDAQKDAAILKEFWWCNRIVDSKGHIKDLVHKIVGDKLWLKLRKILK